MAAGVGVFGPYKHGDKWRVITRTEADGPAEYTSFKSEELARKYVDLARGELDRSQHTVGEAIIAYTAHLQAKGNGKASLKETPRRLRQFYGPHLEDAIEVLTPPTARRLYKRLTETKRTRSGPGGKRVELDTVLSVDTCRNMLAEARSFAKWCVGKHWLKSNPLDGLEGIGKRRHGKPQLRIDEARAWSKVAFKRVEAGDMGALAALMALVLALRAGEITQRVVRDIDDDGRLLWIPDSKTEAGRRQVEIPEALRPHLARLAANRPPGDLLFGHHWVDWISENVRRICKLADVPEVCAHGLRGTHATFAVEAGTTGHVIAASLGHEDFRTTATSYADRASQDRAKRKAALKVLDGGRTEEGEGSEAG